MIFICYFIRWKYYEDLIFKLENKSDRDERGLAQGGKVIGDAFDSEEARRQAASHQRQPLAGTFPPFNLLLEQTWPPPRILM